VSPSGQVSTSCSRKNATKSDKQEGKKRKDDDHVHSEGLEFPYYSLDPVRIRPRKVDHEFVVITAVSENLVMQA
jgi:hypothetical protein